MARPDNVVARRDFISCNKSQSELPGSTILKCRTAKKSEQLGFVHFLNTFAARFHMHETLVQSQLHLWGNGSIIERYRNYTDFIHGFLSPATHVTTPSADKSASTLIINRKSFYHPEFRPLMRFETYQDSDLTLREKTSVVSPTHLRLASLL